MDLELEEAYLIWLYSQIADDSLTNPRRTYWHLTTQMLRKEFIWFVPNDDNRGEDGKLLREEFRREQGYDDLESSWLHLGCSFLEMLIAISRRLAYQTDSDLRDWYWTLLDNLDLHRFDDASYGDSEARLIDEILDGVIWRNYSPDGVGGLFPLEFPQEDQRKIEIWFQMNAYLIERM